MIDKKNLYLKSTLATLFAVALTTLTASPAQATHCYVANKPDGAGTTSVTELKPAGQSGNLVATGAFVDGDEIFGTEDEYPDLFIRGGQDLPEGAPPIAGGGSLPDEPHHNGDSDNGVQQIEVHEE